MRLSSNTSAQHGTKPAPRPLGPAPTEDQAAAVASYRRALALGGTKTLPELYAATGAEFRFDTAMLTDLVNLVETAIGELEAM